MTKGERRVHGGTLVREGNGERVEEREIPEEVPPNINKKIAVGDVHATAVVREPGQQPAQVVPCCVTSEE